MADDKDEVKSPDAEEVPLVRARDILGDLVDRALFDGRATLITRRGRAAAALIPISEYEKLTAA